MIPEDYWASCIFVASDKLYNSWLLYGKNELLLKSLSTDQPYYFTIEAFNENGVSEATKVIHSFRIGAMSCIVYRERCPNGCCSLGCF